MTEQALERYEAEGISALYRSELEEARAKQHAILAMDGCESAIGISVELGDPALQDFTRHCRLATVMLNNLSVPVAIRPEDDQPGVAGENARRIAVALSDYAAALSALATAETPQEVGEAFAAASTSLVNLGSEASSVGRGSPLSPEELKVAQTGASVLQTALVGALEARRYRLLANIVDAADRHVAVASRILASWYFEPDRQQILANYEALRSAMAQYQDAVATESPKRVQLAEVAHEAYETVAAAEESAAWKPFLGIAETHSLIREAMQEPANLESLSAVNARIGKLVEQVQAFVGAVDASKDKS